MYKEDLLKLIKEKEFNKEKLIGWVTALAPGNIPKEPTHNKVGDIYMHPIFLHPIVLMEKKDDAWICGLLTTAPHCPELFCETDSRFVAESYFTSSLFSIQNPSGKFFGVYDNNKHLKKVVKQLRKILK